MKPSLLLAVALAVPLQASAAIEHTDPAAWQQRIEQDWLRELEALKYTGSGGKIKTTEDAAGACDGVINGKWGFHTASESNPWWQVDLGGLHPIAEVRIWNRADGDGDGHARRADHLRVLFSHDGKDWKEVYQHDGTVFFGHRPPERKPLVVSGRELQARFVRVQLPGTQFLHLDEVEVFAVGDLNTNLALHKPADQSSVSQWSSRKNIPGRIEFPIAATLERARKLAAELARAGVNTIAQQSVLDDVAREANAINDETAEEVRRALYLKLRGALRQLAFSNPLLDFDDVLFTKRVPGTYNHMSDQYYGWWSRPGGGIYILRGFKSDAPAVVSLTESFQYPGSFLRPALSYDGQKILFAWARHYPHIAGEKDKLNKANLPEDSFYQIYEMNIDGSGVRRLTSGKYDNFDAQYLPDDRIVFLSTRRGQFVQAGKRSAALTMENPELPDCYVRCGGDARRPVAVYTLHTMNADGSGMIAISPFEMFEWEPSVANDGTILYSRWDYVDRDNMPFMSLWAINPDGTNARLIYGNYTKAPHCTFEPRSIPGSRKIVFTASGHHAQTMGSLVLLDPGVGSEGDAPITRLTPDIKFPEIEGWPRAYFASPRPLSEQTYLVSWGIEDNVREGRSRAPNGMGLYIFDTLGGMEPIYRDAAISSMYPIPLKATPKPPVLTDTVDWDGPQEGKFLLADVYRGLNTVNRGEIKSLRVIAVPAKTQPWMNNPAIGLTRDDPGKAILGTVPVEVDGSAFFRVPSGVPVFFQALDEHGIAVQTMRSATHVQPGQTLSCMGCHDNRKEAPAPFQTLAALRGASKLKKAPEGSWPLRFDRLVQPVLDASCVSCHNPSSENVEAAKFDLTAAKAYKSLVDFGKPSLRELVLEAYYASQSVEGKTPTRRSALFALLRDPNGHHGVKLDAESMERLIVWMDSYAQLKGSFSDSQEEELEELKRSMRDLLSVR
jgi:hypothetical protein